MGACNGSANGASKRVLRVVVPRERGRQRLRALLEQLHVLVERFPGKDELQLVLHDRAGVQIELAGADIAVKHSTELESQVRTLVGEANLAGRERLAQSAGVHLC